MNRAPPAIGAFVLAGGKSRRMGQDKASLPFRNHTLLEHMVQLLLTVTPLVRVIGHDHLPDIVPECGPLGGILTALEASESPLNLIVAVDLPLLTPEFLKWFAQHLNDTGAPALACRVADDFPLCLGVHRDLKPEVTRRIAAGDLALHRWIGAMDCEVISEEALRNAGFATSIFQNFNTPDDWKQLNIG